VSPAGFSRIFSYLPVREHPAMLHVLGCRRCAGEGAAWLIAPVLVERAGVPAGPVYAEALARAEAALAEAAERLAGDRTAAEEAVATLLATPPGQRARRMRREARLRTLPVAALVIDHAEAAAEQPFEAEGLALLAVSILERLTPEEAPGLAVGELKVRAWALVARARWQRRQWQGVREALERAEEAMVLEGEVTRRVGFRRALARMRLLERRMEWLLAETERALALLLGPRGGPLAARAADTEN
jgi:hypothetical protein